MARVIGSGRRPKNDRLFVDGRIAVCRRPDGGYRLDYVDLDGKRRQPRAGRSEEEALSRAEAVLDDLEAEQELRELSHGKGTVAELWQRTLDDNVTDGRWNDNWARDHAGRYRKYVVPVLGADRAWAHVEPADLKAVLNQARGANLAQSSIGHVRAVLLAMESTARLHGFQDPQMKRMDLVKTPKAAKADRTAKRSVGAWQVPSTDRVLALAAAMSTVRYTQNRLVCLIAAFCGLRFGEIHALTPSSFREFDGRTGWVTRRVAQDRSSGRSLAPPKMGKNRWFSWPPSLDGLLAERIDWARTQPPPPGCPEPVLFPTVTGLLIVRQDFRARTFKPAAALVDGWDVDWTFHSLRHHAAVWQLRPAEKGGLGLSLPEVAQVLGHDDPAFTLSRYAGLMENARLEVAAKFSQLRPIDLSPLPVALETVVNSE